MHGSLTAYVQWITERMLLIEGELARSPDEAARLMMKADYLSGAGALVTLAQYHLEAGGSADTNESAQLISEFTVRVDRLRGHGDNLADLPHGNHGDNNKVLPPDNQ